MGLRQRPGLTSTRTPSSSSTRESSSDSASLAVEVAISSLVKDLDVKRRRYADAGVSQYWVLLPAERRIRVHSEPTGSDYAQVEDVERAVFEGAELDLPRLLDGFEDAN